MGYVKDADHISDNLTKIERYGWTVRDAPGQLKYINKNLLLVDVAYQRPYDLKKAQALAADWSWMACGAILVAKRDGDYYVVDGQHRVIAAKKRADILDLPCILFDATCVQEEATAWIGCNSRRKPPSSLDKHRALVAAEDPNAMYLNETCKALGFTITSHACKPMQIKSVVTLTRVLERDRQHFNKLMILLSELCVDHPVTDKLIGGLDYIAQHMDICDSRLRKRVLWVGAATLNRGASKAAAYFAHGGSKVFASGMLDEINRGVRNKFEFVSAAEVTE
jgi:hypothetical protein